MARFVVLREVVVDELDSSTFLDAERRARRLFPGEPIRVQSRVSWEESRRDISTRRPAVEDE